MARRKNTEEEVIVEETVVEEKPKRKQTVTLTSENPFLYIAPYNVQFRNGEYEAPTELVDKLIVYHGVNVK